MPLFLHHFPFLARHPNFIKQTLVQMRYKVDSHWIKCYKMSLWRRSALYSNLLCSPIHGVVVVVVVLSTLHNSMRSFLYFMRLFLVHASVFIHSGGPIHIIHTHTTYTMVWYRKRATGIDIQMGSDIYVYVLCLYACKPFCWTASMRNSVSASNTWKWIVCIFTAYRYFKW